MKLTHRPDIDGLRAIAVIPVVLFHARVPQMSGGFVGVDIFFVISGFLITTLILGDLKAGRFSFANFYERRVRRILPALLIMLALSTVVAQLLLLPEAARDYGASLLATLFFCSNILFSQRSGYFDVPAETRPLLHTWSLSVEEQFYILFPLFLFLVSRYFRQRYAAAIVGALVLSFAWSVWQVDADRTAAFYLAPSRAWELLVGAVLALGILPKVQRKLTAHVLGGLGLCAIGYSVVAFSPDTPFPGVNALVPVLGAALIIYSGTVNESAVSRLLSTRPLVFIGLISYSLYLWHWVIIVFARHYFVLPLSHMQTVGAVLASLLFATLSWQYVELPFRNRQWGGSRVRMFSLAAASVVLLSAYTGLAFFSNIIPRRFPRDVQLALEAERDIWPRARECLGTICRVGAADARPSFILWGDSHGGAIAPVVERVAHSTHRAGFVATKASCAPFLRSRRYDDKRVDCTAFGDSVLQRIESDRIGTVLLHARWAPYVEQRKYKAEPGTAPQLIPSGGSEDNAQALERLLRATLDELRRLQVNVIIIASVPEVGMHVPTVMARAAQSGRALDVAPRYAEFVERQARTVTMLRRVAADYAVRVVYPHELLCDGTYCPIAENRHPLYMDDDHLNVYGAMHLAAMFEPLLERSSVTSVEAGHLPEPAPNAARSCQSPRSAPGHTDSQLPVLCPPSPLQSSPPTNPAQHGDSESAAESRASDPRTPILRR